MITRKKEKRINNRLEGAKSFLFALFKGYLITVSGIFIVAVLLLLLPVSETIVNMGVLLIYFFSCMVCGYHAGKSGNHCVTKGMMAGGTYEMLIMMLSLVLEGSLDKNWKEVISVVTLCITSGGLGACFCTKTNVRKNE